jgi:tetratricopeptide (TPR) repeat protein
MEDAKSLLEEAIRMDPKLAISPEALGYYLYRQGDYLKASAQVKEAIANGDGSFGAAYLRGMLLARESTSIENSNEAVESLKKATQLNPNFAPAFDMLAYAYAQSPAEQKEALEACLRAAKLDPAQHRYAFHYANLLMSNELDADAQHVARRLVAVANSPQEKAEAEALLTRIQQHGHWAVQRKERRAASLEQTATPDANSNEVTEEKPAGSSTPVATRLTSATTMAIEGKGHEVVRARSGSCAQFRFLWKRAAAALCKSGAGGGHCGQGAERHGPRQVPRLGGRRVKVWFHLKQGEKYFGEITKLYFY